MDDMISRQAAIDAVNDVDWYHQNQHGEMVHGANPDEHQAWYKADDIYKAIESVPSAQLAQDLPKGCTDTISRAAVGDALNRIEISRNASWYEFYQKALTAVGTLPSAQPPKEIPKRVLWSGWKGFRNTRYKCPNCEKYVRNDDAYCHRCGQRLMFPKISFTDYVPGQGHELIVRWDDEG